MAPGNRLSARQAGAFATFPNQRMSELTLLDKMPHTIVSAPTRRQALARLAIGENNARLGPKHDGLTLRIQRLTRPCHRQTTGA
jgi:hypothetical protein